MFGITFKCFRKLRLGIIRAAAAVSAALRAVVFFYYKIEINSVVLYIFTERAYGRLPNVKTRVTGAGRTERVVSINRSGGKKNSNNNNKKTKNNNADKIFSLWFTRRYRKHSSVVSK